MTNVPSVSELIVVSSEEPEPKVIVHVPETLVHAYVATHAIPPSTVAS